MYIYDFPGGSDGKASAYNAGDPVWEDPLEKEMASHSSTLAWKIPWTEEPGGQHSPWGRKESDTTEWLHFHFFTFSILSGVISPLIPSSILGTYQPGEFIFQCPIFLPFHTDHGILKASILKWFAIPFSSGPCFFGTWQHDLSILGGPTWHGS